MVCLNESTIQSAYKHLIELLLEHQSESVNELKNTFEINNCCLQIKNPSIDNYWLPYRNVSQKYLNAELNWYYSGDNKVETIGKYAKMWYALSDDNITNNSAYGYILFKKYGYNQLEQIIELLKTDNESRRAILNISDPMLNKINTHDLQCTIAIQFLLRNGKLEETVYMRSNDVFFGLPYDYFFFVSIGKYIAKCLNIELSLYTHHATSMHMYKRDIEKFKEYNIKKININVDKIMEEVYEK